MAVEGRVRARGPHLSELFDSEDWPRARRLIRARLKDDPENHWLWTRLSTTYYKSRRYSLALRFAEKALRLAPNCPLVLWDYAEALNALGRNAEAITIYRRILRRGVDSIAYGQCGEGRRWARSLLNDCRYTIALAYRRQGDFGAAIRWMRMHVTHRCPGIPSLYALRDARQKLDLWVSIRDGDRVLDKIERAIASVG